MINLAVIIPVHNEAGNIIELMRMFDESSLLSSENYSTTIIFVNDGSTDNTANIIKDLERTNVKLYTSNIQRGKANALQMGINYANSAEVIAFLDGDCQDDPREIPKLVSMINSGYDVVIGRRALRRDGFFKRLVSKLYNFLVSKLFHCKFVDINSGLKVIRSDVFVDVKLYGNNHRVFPLICTMLGYKCIEIDVISHERFSGDSKYSLIRVDGLITLISTYLLYKTKNNPLDIFGKLSLIVFTLSFFIFAWLAVNQLLFLFGFSSLEVMVRPMLVISICGVLASIVLFSLGFICEYINYTQQNKSNNV